MVKNNIKQPPTDYDNQVLEWFGEYEGSKIVKKKDICGEYYHFTKYEDCLLTFYHNHDLLNLKVPHYLMIMSI